MTTLRITYKRQLSRIFEKHPAPWREQQDKGIVTITDAAGVVVYARCSNTWSWQLYWTAIRALYNYTRPCMPNLDGVPIRYNRTASNFIHIYPLPWRIIDDPYCSIPAASQFCVVDATGTMILALADLDAFAFMMVMADMATDTAYRRANTDYQIDSDP